MNFHFSSFESKYRKTNADIQYPTIPKIQACVLLHNNENTKVNDKEVSMSGSELMYAGIPLDRNKEGKKYGDFSSLLFYIREE